VLNISVELKDCLFIMFKNERNYKGFHIIIILNDNLNKVLKAFNQSLNNQFSTKILMKFDFCDTALVKRLGQNLDIRKTRQFHEIIWVIKKNEAYCDFKYKKENITISINIENMKKIINILEKLKNCTLVEIGWECDEEIINFWFWDK